MNPHSADMAIHITVIQHPSFSHASITYVGICDKLPPKFQHFYNHYIEASVDVSAGHDPNNDKTILDLLEYLENSNILKQVDECMDQVPKMVSMKPIHTSIIINKYT